MWSLIDDSRCGRCGSALELNSVHDAVACRRCDEWREPPCEDPDCWARCAERPPRPALAVDREPLPTTSHPTHFLTRLAGRSGAREKLPTNGAAFRYEPLPGWTPPRGSLCGSRWQRGTILVTSSITLGPFGLTYHLAISKKRTRPDDEDAARILADFDLHQPLELDGPTFAAQEFKARHFEQSADCDPINQHPCRCLRIPWTPADLMSAPEAALAAYHRKPHHHPKCPSQPGEVGSLS